MIKTQLQIIVDKLNQDGEVSRNWCLERYITRLGSRIYDLRKSGWMFDVERRKGDYIYVLLSKPIPSGRVEFIKEMAYNKVNNY